MPQLHLPMFSHGVIHITDQLAVMKKDGAITYFNGRVPCLVMATTTSPPFA
jgi:hypothetical protein